MLQALLLSSDMYAQELHGTAGRQKADDQWRLAYDSYKLAVSFYLKATAIADELEHHPDHVDARIMVRSGGLRRPRRRRRQRRRPRSLSLSLSLAPHRPPRLPPCC